jgi:hypothetical protein
VSEEDDDFLVLFLEAAKYGWKKSKRAKRAKRQRMPKEQRTLQHSTLNIHD